MLFAGLQLMLCCCCRPLRPQSLFILWRTIEDHDTLFVLAEIAHFVGIGLLGFKMYSKRSAAGNRHRVRRQPARCAAAAAATSRAPHHSSCGPACVAAR